MSVIKDLPNVVGGKTLKSAEPLSKVRQKALILDSDFRKQREKKITIYYSMHFGGFGLKATAKRVFLHFQAQGTRSSSNAMPRCSRWLSFSLLAQDEVLAL